MIHDADHQGVSNAQLVKEGVPLADKYKKRSVAEQNSLDLAWSILMRPHYKLLRACLFETEADLARFRQLVVNVSGHCDWRCSQSPLLKACLNSCGVKSP